MDCPRCRNIPLTPHKDVGTGVTLDVCLKCKGILFDAGELVLVLDVAAKDLRPPSRPTLAPAALCPKCHLPMTAFAYPQTLATIDQCKDCRAIWLDGGEFQEIAAVRRNLRKYKALQEWAPVPGFKGALLRAIHAAITRLTTYD